MDSIDLAIGAGRYCRRKCCGFLDPAFFYRPVEVQYLYENWEFVVVNCRTVLGVVFIWDFGQAYPNSSGLCVQHLRYRIRKGLRCVAGQLVRE